MADLAWEEEVGGIWGGGSLLSVCVEPVSRGSPSQLDGRVVPAGGHRRKFDARCPWFTLGNVCAHDKLSVLYKLLAVSLGDGILNSPIRGFGFFINMRILKYLYYFPFCHPWKQLSKNSLKLHFSTTCFRRSKMPLYVQLNDFFP